VTLEELCAAGELADEHLAAERFEEAEKGYIGLLSGMVDDGEVDAFILAKLTLGLLITELQRGNIESAHEIWVADGEDDAFALGIYSLENDQTSDHDFAVYLFISAFLHSIGTDPKAAEEAVNHYMGQLCEYASNEAPELLAVAVNNWRQHLREIYEQEDPPAEACKAVNEFADKLANPEPDRPIEFPLPGPWEMDPEATVIEDLDVALEDGDSGEDGEDEDEDDDG